MSIAWGFDSCRKGLGVAEVFSTPLLISSLPPQHTALVAQFVFLSGRNLDLLLKLCGWQHDILLACASVTFSVCSWCCDPYRPWPWRGLHCRLKVFCLLGT